MTAGRMGGGGGTSGAKKARLTKKAATPATVLIPWRWWGFTHTAASGVIVGEDTSLVDTYRVLSTMRKVSSDQALSLVVPLSTTNATTNAGSLKMCWPDGLRARR